MKNIVILISGTGSNMAAIIQTAQIESWSSSSPCQAQIAAVISNRPNAKGLETAKAAGIPTQVVDHTAFSQRSDFECALQAVIDAYQPSLVALAGFMRLLGADFVKHYTGRLINIHPSLLPAFPGLHTHERALQAGCRFAGATVHEVTEGLDAGPILAQAVVPILSDDTPESLAKRVLTQEHQIYPQAIARLLKERALCM